MTAIRLLCALLLAGASSTVPAAPPRPVKVMIISMFDQEAAPWNDKLELQQSIPVPGLSPRYPVVRCNSEDVCQLTTDMGKANAAASVAALVHSGLFDLRAAYFLVAGIGGIDPAQGTTGTAAWSRYLVDADLAWELDARERGEGWSTGYLGINTKTPTDVPPLHYGSEMYQLDEALLQRALSLSRDVQLSDSDQARAYRARYGAAPASAPPRVTQCDTMTGNTWYHGTLLGQRARDWFRMLTAGQGTYCIVAQEDNATYTALKRGAEAGLLDLRRVAVLRTASNFDRQPPGMTALESMHAQSGGYPPALRNLYLAGSPLVRDIVAHWQDDAAPTAAAPQPAPAQTPAYAPRVMIVNMFGAEAEPFIKGLALSAKHRVPGLSARYPEVLCNQDHVCQLTTDMGYSNAAASMTALLYASGMDLRDTYFIIAGIAGINPRHGTVATAAWADYAVDFSLSHEIDAREMPADWPYGYFGIHTSAPGVMPRFDYRTEVFQLNTALVDRAYQLSRGVALSDSAGARAYRAGFASAPANQPPVVTRCDTVSGDTWYAGDTLGRRAQEWSALLTGGKARYCTSQQEDNATLEVLRRGQVAGKVDFGRVLILRSASDVDRPHPGQSNRDVLVNYAQQDGFGPSTANLLLAARPVIEAISGNWAHWRQGVPAQ
ncbi:purine nucleoside permease [Duganella sp. 1224]|nr:purine nucleoside permease [Duganella sp. 1224]